MPFLEFMFNQIKWWLPVVLGLLLGLQILYYGWVNLRPAGSRRPRRQPAGPIMPTRPDFTPQPQRQSIPELSMMEPMNEAKMVILSGLPNAPEVPLPSGAFAIGRFYNPGQQVMVALNERSISRRHALVRTAPSLNEYYLSDAGSSYGTSIRKGDQFVAIAPGQEQRLYDGDVVRFGMTVTVRFVLPGDSRAAETQV